MHNFLRAVLIENYEILRDSLIVARLMDAANVDITIMSDQQLDVHRKQIYSGEDRDDVFDVTGKARCNRALAIFMLKPDFAFAWLLDYLVESLHHNTAVVIKKSYDRLRAKRHPDGIIGINQPLTVMDKIVEKKKFAPDSKVKDAAFNGIGTAPNYRKTIEVREAMVQLEDMFDWWIRNGQKFKEEAGFEQGADIILALFDALDRNDVENRYHKSFTEFVDSLPPRPVQEIVSDDE